MLSVAPVEYNNTMLWFDRQFLSVSFEYRLDDVPISELLVSNLHGDVVDLI